MEFFCKSVPVWILQTIIWDKTALAKKRTFILSKSCFSQKAFSLWEQQQQQEWWHFKYNHLEKKRENRLLSLAALLASGLLQILGKGHHQIRQGFQKKKYVFRFLNNSVCSLFGDQSENFLPKKVFLDIPKWKSAAKTMYKDNIFYLFKDSQNNY